MDEADGGILLLQGREQILLSRGIGLGGDACGLGAEQNMLVLKQDLTFHFGHRLSRVYYITETLVCQFFGVPLRKYFWKIAPMFTRSSRMKSIIYLNI
jgi:hypothetical protein